MNSTEVFRLYESQLSGYFHMMQLQGQTEVYKLVEARHNAMQCKTSEAMEQMKLIEEEGDDMKAAMQVRGGQYFLALMHSYYTPLIGII